VTDEETILTGIDGRALVVGDLPGGRSLGGPMMNVGGVGVISTGRAATPASLRAVRKYFAEVSIDDLGRVGDYWVDRATRKLFRRVPGDPLFAERPEDFGVAMFTVTGETIVFLRPAEVETIDDLEEREAGLERERERQEEALDEFRHRQRKVCLNWSEVPQGGGEPMSLRAAAEKIASLSGVVERGRTGLRILIPARLTPDQTYPTAGMAEQPERGAAAQAAVVLLRDEMAVLQAVDDLAADKSKHPRSLAARLPDVAVIGSL
jgi:hypothetical protein